MRILVLIFGIITGLFLGAGVLVFFIFKYQLPTLPAKQKELLEMLSLIKKLTWGNFLETQLRAQTGKPLDRPYGRIRAVFDWDNIQFNPVYLTRTPLNPDIKIDTSLILGPQAQRPLELKIPILIGGMAYGSGYSAAAKIALAKGTARVGTSANTGNGAFLQEEWEYADKLIIQYVRGFWSKTPEILKQADMIEIALGHSARGSAPVRVSGKKLTPEVAARYGSIPGLDVLMEARLPEVATIEDWKGLILNLKEITGGVPIAVKFGASHYLEEEMAIMIEGGIDVLVFDGLEGGTHGGMPVFMDDTGLPILPALCRAASFLKKNELRDKVSLVVGGGLLKPGDFAKCLALGADAVIIGTITAIVQAHTQVTKAFPWEPPTGLLYNDGKEKKLYNPDLGAKHLSNYLQSCVQEMQMLARVVGKSSLRELNQQDLVVLESLYAKITGIELFSSS